MTLASIDAASGPAASGPLLLAMGVCVLAGLVSFASPCVVPLVPGYLSYLAGGRRRRRAASRRGRAARRRVGTRRVPRARVAGAAVLFVAGIHRRVRARHRRGARA